MKKLFLAVTFMLLCQPTYADDGGEIGLVSMYFTPYVSDPQRLICGIIDNETKHIEMAAYGLNDPTIVDALVSARDRDVDICIILDKTQSSLRHQKEAIDKLKRAVVNVLIGRSERRGIMHSKFIVAGDVVEEGSYNYTTQAPRENNNINIFYSPSIANIYHGFFLRIKNGLQK